MVVVMMAKSDFLRGLASAVVAVGLLLAVWGARPAEAAFPGVER